MTDAERDRRWNTAREHYQAARLCFDNGLYGASVTQSYYAAYQGMWIAVGDPPAGRWRHHGLIHHFCWGQWTDPPSPPTALASFRQPLLDLYLLRTRADYDAEPVPKDEAQAALDLTRQALGLVAKQKGLTYP